MQDYKPNSHRSKENNSDEKKQINKVVTEGVTIKKKNNISKFTDVFISEDASNVKSYILMDVLVPAIKKAISDIVRDGIDMVLYGGSAPGSRKSNSHYVSYKDYYDKRNDSGRYRDEYKSKSRFELDEITFKSRGEAEAVRDQMDDIIESYGFVTVSDLYDMVDEKAPYTANRYGWTNLRTAEVVRRRDGYAIKLPRAMPID